MTTHELFKFDTTSCFDSSISKRIEEILIDSSTVEKDPELGRNALLGFVQANWTGPPLEHSLSSVDNNAILSMLHMDGESVHDNILLPSLLLLARHHCQGWWAARALFIHQQILDAPSHTILNLLKVHISLNPQNVQIQLEISLMAQLFGLQKVSEEALQTACSLASFSHTMTGIAGRRTQFQSFDINQLTVDVQEKVDSVTFFENSSLELSQECKSNINVVKNVQLMDDVLLDSPKLESRSPIKTDIGRAILLAHCTHLQNFYAKDTAVVEHTRALVDCVINSFTKPAEVDASSLPKNSKLENSFLHSNNWNIQSCAYYLRSLLETQKTRTVERAALQLQALHDQTTQNHPTLIERCQGGFLFCLPLPSRWEIDRKQARLFAGLGAFRTAASLYERNRLWEEYLACLVQLGESEKALLMLNQMIHDKEESSSTNALPRLLCLRGDITGDINDYHTAWKVSSERCARAMRSLGIYYVRNENLDLAASCLERALQLNSLFERSWFLLGCVYMQKCNWQSSLHALTRCVALDPDNSDAWNNIAAAHMNLQHREEALGALKIAAKLQFDSAKVWENLLRVAMSLGETYEAIAAYRRVVDIQKTFADLSFLTRFNLILSDIVVRLGPADAQAKSLSRQLGSLLEDSMAPHFSQSVEFWTLCADYARACNPNSSSVGKQEIEFVFKALRTVTGVDLSNDYEKFKSAVKCIQRIKQLISISPDSEVMDQLSSIVDVVMVQCKEVFSSTEEYAALLT